MPLEPPNTDRTSNSERGVLVFHHSSTGATLYGLLRNSDGKVWNTATEAWETYQTANLAQYDIALTEQGTASQMYALTLPVAEEVFDEGAVYDRNVRYMHLAVYNTSGAGPAEGDPFIEEHAGYFQRDTTHTRPVRPRSIVWESCSAHVLDGEVHAYSFPAYRRILQLLIQLTRKLRRR